MTSRSSRISFPLRFRPPRLAHSTAFSLGGRMSGSRPTSVLLFPVQFFFFSSVFLNSDVGIGGTWSALTSYCDTGPRCFFHPSPRRVAPAIFRTRDLIHSPTTSPCQRPGSGASLLSQTLGVPCLTFGPAMYRRLRSSVAPPDSVHSYLGLGGSLRNG